MLLYTIQIVSYCDACICRVHLQFIPFGWIRISYTHLDFYLSKKYIDALHKASLYIYSSLG